METKAFKVGDTVLLIEDCNGLQAGAILTISHAGGRAPLDMSNNGNWSYSAALPNGSVYTVYHRAILYASREARIKSLKSKMEEITKLSKKLDNELDKATNYKDDADFLAHQIIEALDKARKKAKDATNVDIQEVMRQEILKMYPSRYKFEE